MRFGRRELLQLGRHAQAAIGHGALHRFDVFADELGIKHRDDVDYSNGNELVGS
jgi:hypothetical protein